MSENSKITWCDHTFNPWWGCVKCGPGCEQCYAERFASRMKHDVWGANKHRRHFGARHWKQPLSWHRKAYKAGVRQRVFCGSMCDLFEVHGNETQNDILNTAREQVWSLIRRTPCLDWLLLTKRPQNVAALIPSDWPFPNVWLGVSVENPDYLWRVEELLKIDAAVRFVSLEPMLARIDMQNYLGIWTNGVVMPSAYRRLKIGQNPTPCLFTATAKPNGAILYERQLDWVIVGAESGPQRRPFDVAWAADIKRQCDAAGVAYFGKQGSGLRPGVPLLIDGRTWHEWPGER